MAFPRKRLYQHLTRQRGGVSRALARIQTRDEPRGLRRAVHARSGHRRRAPSAPAGGQESLQRVQATEAQDRLELLREEQKVWREEELRVEAALGSCVCVVGSLAGLQDYIPFAATTAVLTRSSSRPFSSLISRRIARSVTTPLRRGLLRFGRHRHGDLTDGNRLELRRPFAR